MNTYVDMVQADLELPMDVAADAVFAIRETLARIAAGLEARLPTAHGDARARARSMVCACSGMFSQRL